MTLQPLATDADVIAAATSILRDRLPPRWTVDVAQGAAAGSARAGTNLAVTAPEGTRVTLALQGERSLLTKDVAGLAERLARRKASPAASVPVVISRYLSPAVRAELERRNISYIDATGNVRVAADNPSVFLMDRGAERDPWRLPGRPRGTLKGPPAARVVRALVDFFPPQTARELVQRSGASTGAAYRVLDYLDGEALITRGRRGAIETVRWRSLLGAWSRDYSFQDDSAVSRFLVPRGLPDLLSRLAEVNDEEYAVTGSVAAQRWAPYAPARLAMIYVRNVPTMADRLGLREVDTGANVLLAVPVSDAPFARTNTIDRIVHAAPSQVVADLLTGPGRSPAEAQALAEWMESDERLWRE